jgi:hypothetical protein
VRHLLHILPLDLASKVAAAVIAFGYVLGIVISEGGLTPEVLKESLVLVLPLALIWFPDEIGSFTGYVGHNGTVDTETPPAIVAGLGWFFLVAPLVVYCLA